MDTSSRNYHTLVVRPIDRIKQWISGGTFYLYIVLTAVLPDEYPGDISIIS
jgi:hypothetical protein